MANDQPAQFHPKVGMGATGYWWSDREPFTVIAINSPKCITVQADDARRLDNNGLSESQEYAFAPNPNGRKYTLTLRKNNWWVPKGTAMNRTPYFELGTRQKYYDHSF